MNAQYPSMTFTGMNGRPLGSNGQEAAIACASSLVGKALAVTPPSMRTLQQWPGEEQVSQAEDIIFPIA